MIDYIAMKHVGPASSLKINFASGLNILTGDNWLGKTFILKILPGGFMTKRSHS